MTREPPVVVTAANAGYALPLAVMLRSMLEHLPAGSSPDVFVLDDGLGDELRRKVERSLPGQPRLRWIAPPPGRSGLPLWGRMPATTYCKLLVPRVLPVDLRRALWLDADLLVLADVTELWRQEVEGHAVLAVQDPFVPVLSSRLGVAALDELGLPPHAPYFNAGVMLLNLERWRHDDVPGRADRYLRQYRERVIFHDQEALNVVLAGAWKALGGGWNRSVTAALLGLEEENGPAAILHYSGTLKPWQLPGRDHYHELYYGYLDRTAWAGFRPPDTPWAGMVGRYSASRLRRALQPLEQWWFKRSIERTRSVAGDDLG
jgi:lipopolysaccharide biosynthesis glycosyltransferase